MTALPRYREWSPTLHDRAGLGLPDHQDWYVAPVLYSPAVAGVTDEANWAYMLDKFHELGGRFEDFTVERFGHWASAFEIVLISPAATELVAAAQEMASRLADYPILCEHTLERLECEAQEDAWRAMNQAERRRALRDADPYRSLDRRLIDRMVKRVSLPTDLWDPPHGWSEVLGVQL